MNLTNINIFDFAAPFMGLSSNQPMPFMAGMLISLRPKETGSEATQYRETVI